jgi:hypothetical protein
MNNILTVRQKSHGYKTQKCKEFFHVSHFLIFCFSLA